MRPPVELEPATPADVPIILAGMQDFYRLEAIPYEADAAERALRELLGNPSLGRVWKVLEDGLPVGYAVITLGFSLEFGGRNAFLDELYLRPDCRGRGVGRAALALLERASRQLGARSLALEVHRDNVRAEGLYRRAGFEANGRHLMTRRL